MSPRVEVWYARVSYTTDNDAASPVPRHSHSAAISITRKHPRTQPESLLNARCSPEAKSVRSNSPIRSIRQAPRSIQNGSWFLVNPHRTISFGPLALHGSPTVQQQQRQFPQKATRLPQETRGGPPTPQQKWCMSHTLPSVNPVATRRDDFASLSPFR